MISAEQAMEMTRQIRNQTLKSVVVQKILADIENQVKVACSLGSDFVHIQLDTLSALTTRDLRAISGYLDVLGYETEYTAFGDKPDSLTVRWVKG